MAMMSYAGTVGRPGSYYLRIDDLVDADGRHPGGLETDPYPIAGEPGEAQPIGLAGADPPPQTWRRSDDHPANHPTAGRRGKPAAQIGRRPDRGNRGGASPVSRPRRTGQAPRVMADPPSPTFRLPAISLALFVGALGGFAVLRRRQGKPAHHDRALQIAVGEIQAQAVRVARSEGGMPRAPTAMEPCTPMGGKGRRPASSVPVFLPRLREAGYEDRAAVTVAGDRLRNRAARQFAGRAGTLLDQPAYGRRRHRQKRGRCRAVGLCQPLPAWLQEAG